MSGSHGNQAGERLSMEPGAQDDICALCGIHRRNAGFLRESCGEFFTLPGCFVIVEPSPAAAGSGTRQEPA